MTAARWIFAALLAIGAAFAIKGGCVTSIRAADARLAGHFDKMMCGIARDNIKTPEKGVRELGHYLDKHARDIFGDFGDMIATIERIPDDKKHDKRAELSRDRLAKPLYMCARDWNRFGEAISKDPKATALLQRFNERLSRTFEIIFGSNRDFDMLALPMQLQNSLSEK